MTPSKSAVTELRERLRFVPMPKSKIGQLCKEAADALDLLEAEKERLAEKLAEAESRIAAYERLHDDIIRAERGQLIHDVLANYRVIRRAIMDARALAAGERT